MLEPGEVDVWYCWTDVCLESGLGEYYRSLLTPNELERLARFRFEYLQREFLVTRALCRISLSRYAPVHPAAWRFSSNAYGRPHIVSPTGFESLRFNLSNARSLVACAVVCMSEVGVDVEETDRPGETVAIADRFFSPREVAALNAEPPDLRRRRFFEFWTLKESYIKARGMGLSLPLQQFSFELGSTIRIGFDPELDDDPEDWHFELHQPSERHQLAVGVRRNGDSCLVRVREVVPTAELIAARLVAGC